MFFNYKKSYFVIHSSGYSCHGLEYLMAKKMDTQSIFLVTDDVCHLGTRATYPLYNKNEFENTPYEREIWLCCKVGAD